MAPEYGSLTRQNSKNHKKSKSSNRFRPGFQCNIRAHWDDFVPSEISFWNSDAQIPINNEKCYDFST